MSVPGRRLLAVVGPGEGATLDEIAAAERVAELAARAGWLITCGGRNLGVMAAAARGAARGGGWSIGLLPSRNPDDGATELTVSLPTGLGELRNALIAESCEAMVACGMSLGTATEVAFALRLGKPVVLLRPDKTTREFFVGLAPRQVKLADSADQVLKLLAQGA